MRNLVAIDENEMSYEQLPNAETPEIDNPYDEQQQMIADIEKQIEKKKLESEIKEQIGDEEEESKKDVITPDVPKMLFAFGARALQCERFKLSDAEAKLMSDNINSILPNVNSKLFSVIIIILVILSKVFNCMEAIKAKLRHQPIKVENHPGEVIYQ